MLAAVVGGGLQGVEVCILAKKALWDVVLLDKSPSAPAVNLADTFICFDVENLFQDIDSQIKEIFSKADIVIPALESDSALNSLTAYCEANKIPLAFDKKAYAVSSSKIQSQKFFEQCGTPIPNPARDRKFLQFPLIAKPSKGSGSQGVKLLRSEEELYAYLPDGINSGGWIVEHFCPGRQFSMEICGTPGNYKTFQLTELLMDDVFDCRAVLAPAEEKELEAAISAEIRNLAEKLSLHGIMDIEAVKTETGFNVFEIDARFPSQTPLAVYYSTGINLLEYFVAAFIGYEPKSVRKTTRYAEYFHVACSDGTVFFPGEHSLSQAGPLTILSSVPGTREVIFGGSPESGNWSAVLLLTAESKDELEKNRNTAIKYLTSRTGGQS